MDRFKLTADSTCDLSDELLSKYDIELMGLKVSLGDKDYTDRVDICGADIFAHYEATGTLPKTGARNQEDYKDLFAKHVNSGKKVLHFSLSGELSSSCNNAVAASKEFNVKETNVCVIDTRSLSLGSGMLIVKAHEMFESGMEAKQVAREIEKLKGRVQTSFCVDTLEYLHRGGRCSSVELLGANLLNIHPYINMQDGKLCVYKKFRGSTLRVFKKYVDTLKQEHNPDLSTCFVGHCCCTEEVLDGVLEHITKVFGFKKIILQEVGCAITTHCGKGTLGIGFLDLE